MIQALYIDEVMDGFPETLITMLLIMVSEPIYDWLSIVVLVLAAFFWAIRIKREIQEKYFNNVWRAIKSLFRKRNKYGNDGYK